MTALATPAEPAATLRQARDMYLCENGFTTDAYTDPTFQVPMGRWTLHLPNPRARQRVVAMHDVHHLLTGYGTDFVGECEISAWELRAGLGRNWFAWYICPTLSFLGLLRCPSRTLAAFRAAKGSRSLLHLRKFPEEILDLSVAEARRQQRVPEDGAARNPASLNRGAPGSR